MRPFLMRADQGSSLQPSPLPTGITSVWPLRSSERPPPVPFNDADDVGPALIAAIDGPIARMLLQRLPVGLPHVDVKTDWPHMVGYELLDRRFVAGDARNGDHVSEGT